MNLYESKFYKIWVKGAWTYVTGAILLSIFQIATLASTGDPWGVSGAFANWGAWLYRAVGGNVDKWYYFSSEGAQATLEAGFLKDPGSIRNLGTIVGALLATLLASQFKIKKIKSGKQVVAACVGGLLMGYGARIAFGCNIGALFSGIASLSLSGWVFAIFLFAGAVIGSKLLVKFFM
ncbi:YeeE/YedE thiosulfate transporter family protein [Geosporobacter ferrireducens]|uniref:YeeE/YedE family protein n=1 Tax=Geosporobacter ferrireducens TaxID=1424294 RepID=A0A1D8GET7_9FIRM|nr:YeeE/YedE thiosulfate transporter family protein [Geosporobacter ferrireducens]AOT69405.1 YeeE/YedE family protein [Geosporobacter ferrireducens]MTI56515.1 YeeE/YedE family protein [Geosporobacter ferrireducens]